MPSYSSWLQQGSFTSEQSINQILQAAFSILTYEKVSFAFFCGKVISNQTNIRRINLTFWECQSSVQMTFTSDWRNSKQLSLEMQMAPCGGYSCQIISLSFWRFLDPNYISSSSMYKPASTPLSRLSYYIYSARLYPRYELCFHIYLLTHPRYYLRIHTWSRNMAKSTPLLAVSRECMLRKPYLKVSLAQRFWLGDSNWILQMNIHTSYGTPQTWPMCSAAQYL